MAVIQVPMEISENAFDGLMSGVNVRHGGVIYSVNGGIVEHLKDVNDSQEVGENAVSVAKSAPEKVGDLLKKASDYLKDNKGKAGIFIGGAVVIGGAAYYGMKQFLKQKKQPEAIDIVTDNEFNELLSVYMLAAKEGKLTLDIIIELKEKLISISNETGNTIVAIDIKQLQALIGYIEKYTEDLAIANNYSITDAQRGDINEDSIVKLTKYLMIQEDIFNKAS